MGYIESNPQTHTPSVCDICGVQVVPEFRTMHDDWHKKLKKKFQRADSEMRSRTDPRLFDSYK